MYYIVFSRKRHKDGGLISSLYFKGASKSNAVIAFTNAAASSFNVTSAEGDLYFAGFKSDLAFIKEIKKLNIKWTDSDCPPEDKEIINTVLRNLGLATCLNTLNISGYKPKFAVVHECVECDSDSALVQKNVYGDHLCTDCWAKYWNTRKSLAEYVIGLANNTYKAESFNEEDKEAIVDAWLNKELDDYGEEIGNSNRTLLLDSEAYTDAELTAIEKASGLFTK